MRSRIEKCHELGKINATCRRKLKTRRTTLLSDHCHGFLVHNNSVLDQRKLCSPDKFYITQCLSIESPPDGVLRSLKLTSYTYLCRVTQ